MAKSQETQVTKLKGKHEIRGGCHCQAVRFKATVLLDAVILRCNCSICAMTGFNHLIVNHADFELISGQSELNKYQFNTHQAVHLFCRICGIKSFYQPRSHPDSWSINSHCIDQFDANEWRHDDFDGQNWLAAKGKLASPNYHQDSNDD